MAKFSPLMLAPPLVFAGFVAFTAVGMFRDNPDELEATRIGQLAPPVPQEGLEGFEKLNQSDLASGEVMIVNFWASWCPPCRAEHPNLLALEEGGLKIAGINFKDSAADASGYLSRDGNPFFALGFDPKGRTAIDWGVTAPPETFILDGTGTVLYRFTGPLIGADFQNRFLPELRKAQANE